MSWGRNDDNMLEHLKWKMLEDDARTWADALALWSAARDYANRASTDGYIPDVCLRSLTPMDKKRAKAVADALVSAKPPGYAHGLWERVEGGYQIHDFLKYNESRASKAAKADQERANAEQAEADRNAERAADAARKRAKRHGKADASGECPPDSPPDTDRTDGGQSARHEAGQVAAIPPDVLAPARSRAYVRAPDPGPARPDPDLSSQKGDLDQVARGARATELRTEQVRAAFADAFRATGAQAPPWLNGLTNDREWGELRAWLADTFPGTEVETARALGDGFGRHAFAKRRGHPFRGGNGSLMHGPGEFLQNGHAKPSSFDHVRTSALDRLPEDSR